MGYEQDFASWWDTARAQSPTNLAIISINIDVDILSQKIDLSNFNNQSTPKWMCPLSYNTDCQKTKKIFTFTLLSSTITQQKFPLLQWHVFQSTTYYLKTLKNRESCRKIINILYYGSIFLWHKGEGTGQNIHLTSGSCRHSWRHLLTPADTNAWLHHCNYGLRNTKQWKFQDQAVMPNLPEERAQNLSVWINRSVTALQDKFYLVKIPRQIAKIWVMERMLYSVVDILAKLDRKVQKHLKCGHSSPFLVRSFPMILMMQVLRPW
jgi:hypothetical protein